MGCRKFILKLFTVGVLTWMPALWGQNLVLNAGFEAYSSCPAALGNLQADSEYWESPTQGSTDYFNSCSDQMGVPKNYNGTQAAREGKGYAGFYAYAPGDYREYLMGRFRSPLKAGSQYAVTVYLSLSERSDYAIGEFGILLCNRPIRAATKKQLSRKYWFSDPENAYQFLTIGTGSFAGDTGQWVQLTARFEAKGGEQYLVLGNFEPNRQTRTQRTGRQSNRGAYYYVDAVEVKAVGDTTPEQEAITASFPLDSLLLLPELTFEFDTFRISETGQARLDSLYRFLQRTGDLRLELRGHTDSQGRPAYNRLLSEQRCRAVSDYLQGLGLDAGRVRWQGYGASRPVATNNSSAGRSRNRRVEFLILSGAPETPKRK